MDDAKIEMLRGEYWRARQLVASLDVAVGEAGEPPLDAMRIYVDRLVAAERVHLLEVICDIHGLIADAPRTLN